MTPIPLTFGISGDGEEVTDGTSITQEATPGSFPATNGYRLGPLCMPLGNQDQCEVEDALAYERSRSGT